MSKERIVIGIIVAASAIPEGSKKGHDQLLVYVENADEEIFRVWETLASTKCDKGRNKGEPYRDVRLKELGIPKFSDADTTLEGRRAIISYAVQKDNDGEVITDDKGESLWSWSLDRILPLRAEDVPA